MVIWLFKFLRKALVKKGKTLTFWELSKITLILIILFFTSLNSIYKPIEPLELLYARNLLGLNKIELYNEKAAFDRLRNFIDLPLGRQWLGYDYPIVHIPKKVVENQIVDTLAHPDIIIVFFESLRGENLKHINPYLIFMCQPQTLPNSVKKP